MLSRYLVLPVVALLVLSGCGAGAVTAEDPVDPSASGSRTSPPVAPAQTASAPAEPESAPGTKAPCTELVSILDNTGLMANVVTLGAARELGVPEDAATRDIEPVKKDVYAFATLATMKGLSITAPDGLEDELNTVVSTSTEVSEVLADAGWVEAFDVVRQKRFVQSEARLHRFVDGPHCD